MNTLEISITGPVPMSRFFLTAKSETNANATGKVYDLPATLAHAEEFPISLPDQEIPNNGFGLL